MALQPLTLPGARVEFAPDWMPAEAARALFDALRADIHWEVHRIRLFGREIDSPRLSCWIGDAGTSYTYSGSRFEPNPWPAALVPVRSALEAALGVPFNSVLANQYRDGRDYMGWHSDNEAGLGPQPVIASLSLGAPRRFLLKPKAGGASHALVLPSGSLLVMSGDTQRHWKHALPRTARPTGPRINLTFRRIVDPR